MTSLPEITNFDEAVTVIGQLNQLQAELTTLRQPMTDLELIITHTNKYAPCDQFVNIQLKYLQATAVDIGELAPSFKSPTLPSKPVLPELSWAAYSLDVATYARAHKHVKRTTSVLSASTSFPPRDTITRPSFRDNDPATRRSQYPSNRDRDRSRSRDRDHRPYPVRDRSRDRDTRHYSDRDNRSHTRSGSSSRDSHSRDRSRSADRAEYRKSDNRGSSASLQMSDEKYRQYQAAKAKAYAEVRAQFSLPPPKSTKPDRDRRVNAAVAETPQPTQAAAPDSTFRALRATSSSPQAFSRYSDSDSDTYEEFHD